jgi:hypothetical protein
VASKSPAKAKPIAPVRAAATTAAKTKVKTEVSAPNKKSATTAKAPVKPAAATVASKAPIVKAGTAKAAPAPAAAGKAPVAAAKAAAPIKGTKGTAAALMAARAKAASPNFIVVSQNGDQLIPNPKFRKAIDAFAREDLLFGEDADGVRNRASSIRESVARLKKLTAEGKPVFVVEYPRDDAQAKTAERELSKHGFVGLVARRELDVLER